MGSQAFVTEAWLRAFNDLREARKDLMKTLGLVLGALLVGLLGFLPLGNVVVSGPVGLTGWHSRDFGALGLTLAAYLIGGFAIDGEGENPARDSPPGL